MDMSGFRLNVPAQWMQPYQAAPGALGSGMAPMGIPSLDPNTLGSGMSGINTTGLGTVQQAPQMGLGMNLPTAQLGLGALNSLGNLWQSWNASKLAKEQLNFTKEFTNTNLNNSIQSYNTALADRAHSRAAMEGRSTGSAQEYINQNAMRR